MRNTPAVALRLSASAVKKIRSAKHKSELIAFYVEK